MFVVINSLDLEFLISLWESSIIGILEHLEARDKII